MMMFSGRRAARQRRARADELRDTLEALRESRADARRAFNRCTDPALLEASILEYDALQARYGCLLRTLKEELRGES